MSAVLPSLLSEPLSTAWLLALHAGQGQEWVGSGVSSAGERMCHGSQVAQQGLKLTHSSRREMGNDIGGVERSGLNRRARTGELVPAVS